ncbi:hypothetical protein M407DRAFT_241850 [Tulasnella calospora MUT 4182]|uniref:Uncharacterized protein n=1 Tax=Tulasnella calospora MUT 4182 TaxID=1051891 RepID=A0A0C3LBR0_9AGAM|nr:hypothetical protein M407DRAFT_241850 [Tulasnella calospora MUT 4182]
MERAHSYFQDDDIPTPLSENVGKPVRFDNKKAFKALEPRSCLLLLGPDPFSAQSIKKTLNEPRIATMYLSQ